MTDDEKQGRKFTVTTEINVPAPGFAASVTATMRCVGRKTTWTATRATKEDAVAGVLLYLRDAIRPFVKVS